MVLTVDLSARISPLTSTVIFFERSPFATAVVTSAMLRTWPVRFAAIEFTLSVRSFHVPATPGTRAWPPHLPPPPPPHPGPRPCLSRGEAVQRAHHGVNDFPDPQKLTTQRPAIDLEYHGLQKIA